MSVNLSDVVTAVNLEEQLFHLRVIVVAANPLTEGAAQSLLTSSAWSVHNPLVDQTLYIFWSILNLFGARNKPLRQDHPLG